MSAPDRIVVGMDESRDARRALAWALSLAEGSDAEIVAVHALGLLTHLEGPSLVPSAGHRGAIAARLENEWCDALKGNPTAHRCLVVDGEPVHVLLEAAREVDAGLIVVGRRGSCGHPGLLIGSTSQQLVHQADRPVVVIPAEPVVR